MQERLEDVKREGGKLEGLREVWGGHHNAQLLSRRKANE